MRLYDIPRSLLCFCAAIIVQPAAAGLIPGLFFGDESLPKLEDRQDVAKRCNNLCGYYNQLCCDSDQYCYTDASNRAQCGNSPATTAAQAASGNWVYYTTTYVSIDLQTITTVVSSWCGMTSAVVTTTVNCASSQGETACGDVCCGSGSYCASLNTCKPNGGGGNSGYYSSNFVTLTVVTTQSASVPTRPTSDATFTSYTTATPTATTTGPYVVPSGIIQPAQPSRTGGGLGAGAIAGIVIGVIVGIIILLLICACCCAKELVESILAFFGLGPRRRRTRREETIIEERRSRHGRTWYGGSRPSRPPRSEEKQGGFGFGGVAVLLLGLAAALGLKRRHDRRDEKSSTATYSYYDETDITSSSSASSDRRSRRTSRSRRSSRRR